MRALLMVTALLEAATGLALAFEPSLVIRLFFGVALASPEALAMSRLCGVALLAVGVACWSAREEANGRSQRAVLRAMLVYNIGGCAVLALAGAVQNMAGLALWPGVLIHGALAVWCLTYFDIPDTLRRLSISVRS